MSVEIQEEDDPARNIPNISNDIHVSGNFNSQATIVLSLGLRVRRLNFSELMKINIMIFLTCVVYFSGKFLFCPIKKVLAIIMNLGQNMY